MMYWLTEDAFVPFITGVFMFAVFGGFAYATREKSMFYACGLIALVTLVFVTVEQIVVTDRESIEEEVYQLAFHVQRNDMENVIRSVEPNDTETINRIRGEMPRYDFEMCRLMGITDFKSTGTDPATAEVEFTVAVQVRLDQTPDLLSGQRRVRLFYEKNAEGKWKITDYHHYDPRRGLDL